MCTVTYLPRKHGFILSVNRDEMADRPKASFPNYMDSKRGRLSFPKDPQAGGTWLAYSNELIVSLINGSYQDDPDRFTKSRGLVCLEPFQFSSLEEYIKNCDFSEVNAFVMNIFEKEDGIWQITTLEWDTEDLEISYPLSSEPHIWVSIPKKFNEVLEWREDTFDELMQLDQLNPKSMEDFHLKEGMPGEKAVRLAPNDIVYTTNFTQIQAGENVKLIQHKSF